MLRPECSNVASSLFLSRLKCFVFSVTYRKHFDVDLFAVNLPARLSYIVMPKSIIPLPAVSKMTLMENLRDYFARKLYYETRNLLV